MRIFIVCLEMLHISFIRLPSTCLICNVWLGKKDTIVSVSYADFILVLSI